MGNRPDGTSDVLIEDDVVVSPAKIIQELWVNDATPANPASTGDPVAGKQVIHEPPDGGAVFRMLMLPPKRDWPTPTAEQMVEMHRAISSTHVPTVEYLRTAKSVTMHKTNTLNYFVLISGELVAMSEGRDVVLKPGDVLIQKGCMHGWENRTSEPAILCGVLVDSLPA
jgi:mannose-6-phosphate isomerase-like protein (cupin superfamily)